MINVVLIGAGNIGTRYLQAMVDDNRFTGSNIYVVDSESRALENARNIVRDSANAYFFCNEISQLPKVIDCAAVTTTSRVRRGIVETLLNEKKVKNIILEKYLFPYERDYGEMKEAFKNHGCKVWVNCTRRAQDSYKELKQSLSESESIQMTVSGSNWGMVCNAIHFLDIIAYLAGSADFQIDISGLNDKVVESKRKGYKETTGTIRGKVGRCTDFSIVCYEKGALPLTIYISSDTEKLVINETMQTLSVLQDNGEWEMKEFRMRYISQTMGDIIQDILLKGCCDLASFEESMMIHLALQKELTDFFGRHGVEKGLCPIT